MYKTTLFPLFALLIFGAVLIYSCEQQPYQMGERLYKTHCANCHMDNGEGLAGLMPPLAGSDYLAQHRERIPCIIRNGLQDTIVVNGKVYAEQMLPNSLLSDIQITNIANYIFQSWGNQLPPLSFEEAQKALEACRR